MLNGGNSKIIMTEQLFQEQIQELIPTGRCPVWLVRLGSRGKETKNLCAKVRICSMYVSAILYGMCVCA